MGRKPVTKSCGSGCDIKAKAEDKAKAKEFSNSQILKFSNLNGKDFSN